MATRQAQQALVPGRLVLVSDPVTGMPGPSVVLGEPQGYTAPSRTVSATGAVTRSSVAIMLPSLVVRAHGRHSHAVETRSSLGRWRGGRCRHDSPAFRHRDHADCRSRTAL